MTFWKTFAARCSRCAHEFLRGADLCGSCGRGLEGFSLSDHRTETSWKRKLDRFLSGNEKREIPGSERSFIDSLADWRDPTVLKIVAVAAVVLIVVAIFG